MNVKVGDDVFTIASDAAEHLRITRKLSYPTRWSNIEECRQYVHEAAVKLYKKMPEDFWVTIIHALPFTRPNRNGDCFSIDAALRLASEPW